MSLVLGVRPSSRTSPSMCWKIRYNIRNDTAEIMPDRRSPLVSSVCHVLEPHRYLTRRAAAHSQGFRRWHGLLKDLLRHDRANVSTRTPYGSSVAGQTQTSGT